MVQEQTEQITLKHPSGTGNTEKHIKNRDTNCFFGVSPSYFCHCFLFQFSEEQDVKQSQK